MDNNDIKKCIIGKPRTYLYFKNIGWVEIYSKKSKSLRKIDLGEILKISYNIRKKYVLKKIRKNKSIKRL